MELIELIREYEAIRLWEAGKVPHFSTGVCDSLTCGYGKCSEYGYWEYPLYPAEEYLAKVKRHEI